MPVIERRSFVTGLFSLVAAPAIVRPSSLMPVKVTVSLGDWGRSVSMAELMEAQRRINFYHSEMLKCVIPVRWITKAEALEMFPDPRG